jgi:hypothetical protein
MRKIDGRHEPNKKYPHKRMASLIPRALAAVLAPIPSLPLTMPPEYRKTAPLKEVIVDSTGPNTKKHQWYTVSNSNQESVKTSLGYK